MLDTSATFVLIRHDIARYQQASPRGAVSKQILQNATDQLRAVEAEYRETQAELDRQRARAPLGVHRTWRGTSNANGAAEDHDSEAG